MINHERSLLRKKINPMDFDDSPFSKKAVRLKPGIKNFGSIRKKDLQERVELLSQELSGLGLHPAKLPEIYFSTSRGKSVEVPIVIPYITAYPFTRQLMDDKKLISDYRINYFVTAEVYPSQHPISMVLETRRFYRPPYVITLLDNANLNLKREILLESLPMDPYSVGLSYDLDKNPSLRESLAGIGGKEIPAGFFSGSELEKSLVTGFEDEKGLRILVHLYFQQNGSGKPLDCYEVEIFKGHTHYHPDILEIVPGSKWQEDQFHYCIPKKESYPLLPVDIGKACKITIVAHPSHNSPLNLKDILSGIPLPVGGEEQWFAEGDFGEGSLGFLYNPQFRGNKGMVVYRQGGNAEFTAGSIYKAVREFDTVRNAQKCDAFL